MSKSSIDNKSAERTSRAQTAREVDYSPPSHLMIPDAVMKREKSNGNILRWIRISFGGEADYKNVSQRTAEGYVFLQTTDAPELDGLTQVVESPKWGSLITVGDLALARIPEAKARARQKYYENVSDLAMSAVSQELRRSSTRDMPIYDDSSRTSSRGRAVDFG